MTTDEMQHILKQAPYSIEAEQAILAAILHDNKVLYRIGDLAKEDFYRYDHRVLFGDILEMISDGQTPDFVTMLDHAVGKDVLYQLTKVPYAIANVGHYANLVREKARQRRVIAALNKAADLAYEGDAEAAIAECMAAIEGNARGESKTFADATQEGFSEFRDAAEKRAAGGVLGINTTLPQVNHWLGGFYGARLYVLGGRPGTYKSAYALQVLLSAARNKIPVGLISLEMPAWEIASRAFANEYRINSLELTTGDKNALRRLESTYKPEFSKLPIHIDCTSQRLVDIRSRVLEWKHKHDVQLVVIDHIQLIKTKANSRFEELSEISRVLKLLTMEINTPILLLSQISRDVEKQGRRPLPSDLRECGNIEQDADAILFTHCIPGKGVENDQFEMICGKNRGGPARQIVDLSIQPEFNIIGEHWEGYQGYKEGA